MLKLTNIQKSYKTFDFVQTALDGASICFRNNEFAAILGPSGSGKTTMLNIIGGLDKYDSGDLEIDGISTKKYKDKDWDAYRNNRIGFVFQSYNLIAHQTILSNVELALTLSGVSRVERKERAKKALEDVGLGEHIRKRPSQLSGGQMQRVAIARALINDPEILLADEPTGALDTNTSTQVMDLLTKIAKDRLVIMVTHNSELAEEYANRIVHLKDGKIVSDSRPFDPAKENNRPSRPAKKASMSFLTAIALSFSNLMTKKGRTLVTAIAGSIGIIGIAAILALANGIDLYIKNTEEETLSLYPLTIQETGLDLSSMISDGRSESNKTKTGDVGERRMVENLFSKRSKNDLASLKLYLDGNKKEVDKYVNTIGYKYDITPQIYLADTKNSIEQVNPDSILSSAGMGTNNAMASMLPIANMGGMNVFSEMPGAQKVYENQYEVLAGNWPKNYNEVVLVLSASGTITDYELYAMGLRDRAELKTMVENIMNKEDATVELEEAKGGYSYETLMSVDFKVVNAADKYQYDKTYKVWVDKSGDKTYMKALVDKGISLKIVGVVKPTGTTASLTSGINYTPALIKELMEQAANSEIVKDQIRRPAINVLTGNTFLKEQEGGNSAFDFSKLISIDEKALKKAFNMDFSSMNIDLSGIKLDLSDLAFDQLTLEMPDIDIAALIDAVSKEVSIPADQVAGLMDDILEDFLLEEAGKGVTDPNQIVADLSAYLSRSDVQAKINSELAKIIQPSVLEKQITEAIQKVILDAMEIQIQKAMSGITKQLEQAMAGVMGQITVQMQKAMGELPNQMQNIDKNAFAKAFKMNMNEEGIYEIMKSMMNPVESTYERNLSLLGYADPDVPSSINIYPRDFESKQKMMELLDSYNEKMEAAGETDKVVRYTDIVGALMSSVTDIVDMVSFALIAFVAISLVVSSIMIGVITYISVLERKKEIGILRAIGASKKNIRSVFNAETLIVGFVAGLIGVLVTLFISFVANIIILAKFDIANIAQLPMAAAVTLVGVSMFLTYIAGLFPSSAAARKDPVEALRSE